MDLEKKFDSAEAIMAALKKEKIVPERMYLGFINSVYDCLANRPLSINGAPAEDFFIQGLIAITGNIEAFKAALEYFMNKYDMKY